MSKSAVQKFIAATRELFAAESDPKRRWEKMPPLLRELLADPAALSALHWAVWTSPARHPSWQALTEGAPARARGVPDRETPSADPHAEQPSVAASDAAAGG